MYWQKFVSESRGIQKRKPFEMIQNPNQIRLFELFGFRKMFTLMSFLSHRHFHQPSIRLPKQRRLNICNSKISPSKTLKRKIDQKKERHGSK